MHGMFGESGCSLEYSEEMCDPTGHQNQSYPYIEYIKELRRCYLRLSSRVVESRCSTSASKLPLLCEKIENAGLLFSPVLLRGLFLGPLVPAFVHRTIALQRTSKYRPLCFLFRAKSALFEKESEQSDWTIVSRGEELGSRHTSLSSSDPTIQQSNAQRPTGHPGFTREESNGNETQTRSCFENTNDHSGNIRQGESTNGKQRPS